MKLVSFRAAGAARFGVVDGTGIADLSERLRGRFADLKSVLIGGGLAAAEQAAKNAEADFRTDQVIFDPVIPNPAKIICIGLNYEEHRNETGRAKVDNPTTFIRFSDTQLGHLQPIVKPKQSDALDYEGELAVIIGRGGRYISAEKAFDHVAGYACYNDASVRDFQKHTTQFTAGKNFPATGPFGPFLVTRDEMGMVGPQKIQTRLNGQIVQEASLDMMLFPIPRLIEYVSRFTPLAPGDVIVTGTPGGVGMGRTPPLWMKVGDTVEVEIDGVGILKNSVVGEA